MKKHTIDYLILTKFVIILFFGVILSSCDGENCEEDESYAALSVKIEVDRLEDEVNALTSPEHIVEFLQANRTVADHFLLAKDYPNDTILSRRMYRLFKNASFDTLIMETKAHFSAFDENVAELERGFRFIKSHYPETIVPKLQTMISGFCNDLYISDTLVVIGLDYFVGTSGRYQPNDIPQYIAKRYKKESVAPIVLSFFSNNYNQTDQSHGTLMADMINIGKSYYFVKQALPCVADSLIIGYTPEEIRLVNANQETIWASLIENDMLFETDHTLKNKFVGESPNIPEIGEKCPGRVGAWLGWEIVKKYMDRNPEVTFQELMADRDAHRLFQRSGYKPTNK